MFNVTDEEYKAFKELICKENKYMQAAIKRHIEIVNKKTDLFIEGRLE